MANLKPQQGPSIHAGQAGETHQTAGGGHPALTTNQGCPGCR